MEKIILLLCLILMFTFTTYAQNETTIGTQFGKDYISGYVIYKNYIFGLGRAFTGDDYIPDGHEFSGSSLNWWTETDTYQDDEMDIIFGRNLNINEKFNIKLCVDLILYDEYDFYFSTVTGIFYEKSHDTKTDFSCQINGEYKLSDKIKLNLGYHERYGVIGGIGICF